jgi:hypothetical protein
LDSTTIFIIGLTTVCPVVFFLINGWKAGFKFISFFIVFSGVYFFTIKYWGEEGEKYLAIILACIVAPYVLYTRYKKGHSLW